MLIEKYIYKGSDCGFQVYFSNQKDWYIIPDGEVSKAFNIIEKNESIIIMAPPRSQKSMLLSILYMKVKDRMTCYIDFKHDSNKSYQAVLQKIQTKIVDRVGQYLDVEKNRYITCKLSKLFFKIDEMLHEKLIVFLDSMEEIKIRAYSEILESIKNYSEMTKGKKLQFVITSSYFIPSANPMKTEAWKSFPTLNIENLSEKAIITLLKHIQMQENVILSKEVINYIIAELGNDRATTLKVLGKAIFKADSATDHWYPNYKVNVELFDVKYAIEWFKKYEILNYVPIKRSIRVIESNPDILLLVLPFILGKKRKKYSHDIIETLVYTGAFKYEPIENTVVVKNKLYLAALKRHFTIDRVVYNLQTASLWDESLNLLGEYLDEKSEQTSYYYRAKYIETLFACMNAVTNIDVCFTMLRTSLLKLFGIKNVTFVLKELYYLGSGMVLSDHHYTKLIEGTIKETEEAYLSDYFYGIYDNIDSLILPLKDNQLNTYGYLVAPGYKKKPQSDEFFWVMNFIKRLGIVLKVIIDKFLYEYEVNSYSYKMEKLNKIAGDLVSMLDVNLILDSINQIIVELLDADSSLFFLVDTEKKQIIKAKTEPYSYEWKSKVDWNELMEGISGEVIYSEQSVMHSNAQECRYNKGKALENCKNHGTGPIIVVPLFVKAKEKEKNNDGIYTHTTKKLIGTLTACRKYGRGRFRETDLNIASMLAAQAAIAFENANLYTKMKEATKYARIVARATLAEGLKKTAKQILYGVNEVMGCTSSMLIALDPKTANNTWPPTVTGTFNYTTKMDIGEASDLIEKLIAENEISLFKRNQNTSIFEHILISGSCLDSIISVPLKISDIDKEDTSIPERVGVLLLGYESDYNISNEDIGLLQLFAIQAAVAIYKDFLYEEMEQQRRKVGAHKAISYISAQSSILNHKIQGYIVNIKAKLENATETINLLIDDEYNYEKEKYINHISKKIEEALLTIDDLIAIKKRTMPSAQYGKIEFIKGIELNTRYFNKIISECSHYNSTLRVKAEVKNDLEDTIIVKMYREHLKLILEILLNNSLREIQENFKNTIYIKIIQIEEYIQIIVKDYGSGIPHDRRKNIFKKNIHKAIEEEGSGIGMLLSSILVESSGGDISVANSNPGGTGVVIKLPFIKEIKEKLHIESSY